MQAVDYQGSSDILGELMCYSLDGVYQETAWEFTSTLFERKSRQNHSIPLFDSTSLFCYQLRGG